MTTHNEDRTAGVIATLTDGHVMHAPGSRREAMLRVAEVCDRRGVKIQTISTSQSIVGDLRGGRPQVVARERDALDRVYLDLPVSRYAGLIGRGDLVAKPRSSWAPSL